MVAIQALASRVLSPLPVGACLLIAWVVLTGALHLDGLGDLCDALYAGTTPSDRLRIMKDPHIGAVGVVGIVTILLTKFSLLAIAPSPSALLLSPCVGRYVMVLLATTLPYARTGSGTAAAFVRSSRPRDLIVASATTLLAIIWMLGLVGIGLLAAVLAGGLVLRELSRRSLGGITGDALGASGELVETLALLML